MEPDTAIEQPKANIKVSSSNKKMIWATGRRKSAVAQIQMVPSSNTGKIKINGQSVEGYFKGNQKQALVATQSYQLIKNASSFNFNVKVNGGGITGQSEAIRYGIARALVQLDPKIRLILRKEGYLTRDPRSVERKKSGQPKARKRFQYSKR